MSVLEPVNGIIQLSEKFRAIFKCSVSIFCIFSVYHNHKRCEKHTDNACGQEKRQWYQSYKTKQKTKKNKQTNKQTNKQANKTPPKWINEHIQI